MLPRRVVSLLPVGLIATMLAGALGCGGSDFGAVQVSGTVKYSDGSIPTGEIATITFQPKASAADRKGASGTIQADGSYKLTSVDVDDGALPGDYIVLVNVMESYVDGKFAVAEKYRNPIDSPLKATVTAAGPNNFDFTIERE